MKGPAVGMPTPEMAPLPTTLPAAALPNGNPAPRSRPATQPIRPIVKLTLQEVIHRTVINSLDVRVAGYQPAIDELRILEEEGAFDPSIFLSPSLQRQFPQGVIPTSLNPNELMTQVVSGGLRQKFLSGGQAELKYQAQRYNFQKPVGIFNTALVRDTVWDNQVVLQITQPLLQNYGEEINRAKITIARNDQKISQLDFRSALEKQIQTVEETYWKLLIAQRDVQIQSQLLMDTESTLDTIIRRMRVDATPLNVSQVRSSAEQRNASLIDARGQLGSLSDDLKRLMSDPQFPPGGPEIIVPADAPIEEPVRFSLADQIGTALHNRLELLQQLLRIDSALTVIKAARNNMLPQLNLQGQVGVEGWGNGPNESFEQMVETQLFNYAIGLQFEVPLGNRVARAIYQRTLLQHMEAVLEYQRLAQLVITEVSKAQRELDTSWQLMDATRRATFAARDALEQYQKREGGSQPLTPEFLQLKLQLQSDLANAQRQEIQSVARYNIALSALELAKGTLLRYNNIVMKEEKGPKRAMLATMSTAAADAKAKKRR